MADENSELFHEQTIIPLPLDACLREAASAKAGGRACPVEYVPLLHRVKVGVTQVVSPSPSPC
jgi:hypothetical protein